MLKTKEVEGAEEVEAVGADSTTESSSESSTVSTPKTSDPIRVSQNPLGLCVTLYIGK
jgi:hypothetical protein